MRLVTMFWPLTTTGPRRTVAQTVGERRFVVHCKVKPVALLGHVRITYAPERTIASGGVLTDPKERLNTVPLPELPPDDAVPYNVPPDKINSALGLAPSLLV